MRNAKKIMSSNNPQATDTARTPISNAKPSIISSEHRMIAMLKAKLFRKADMENLEIFLQFIRKPQRIVDLDQARKDEQQANQYPANPNHISSFHSEFYQGKNRVVQHILVIGLHPF